MHVLYIITHKVYLDVDAPLLLSVFPLSIGTNTCETQVAEYYNGTGLEQQQLNYVTSFYSSSFQFNQ